MRIRPIIAMTFGAVLTVSHAHATTLSAEMTVDDAFFAYLGTSPSSLDTLVASAIGWTTPVSFTSFSLTPGQTYYLNIEAFNYSGRGALLGQFTLSDANFQFLNGTQFLKSNIDVGVYGSYNNSSSNPTLLPWVQPTGSVVSYGVNGDSPWGTFLGIDATAMWIWPTDANNCDHCIVDFSVPILASETPLPAALPLFATGLGALGLLGWRRKRKAAALAAA
jgi:hypothetical protein